MFCKIRLILLILFAAFESTAQGVISCPEYAVLYREYDNRIELGAGRMTKSLTLEGEGVNVQKQDDSSFIVRITGTGRTVVLNVKNTKTGKIVEQWSYRVMNLPPSVLYWGKYVDGSKITLDQEQLSVNYGDPALFGNSLFTVIVYEVLIEGVEESFKVAGSEIAPEIIEGLKMARALKEGKEIEVTVVATIAHRDCILRKKIAKFFY
ncbi:hypothetical protein D3C71_592820 [compost metagenome]